MSADFGYKGVAALIDDLPVPTRLNKCDTFGSCRAFHDVALLLVPSRRMSREKSWCSPPPPSFVPPGGSNVMSMAVSIEPLPTATERDVAHPFRFVAFRDG